MQKYKPKNKSVKKKKKKNVKLELIRVSKINTLGKNPIKGGTPARERRVAVKDNKK